MRLKLLLYEFHISREVREFYDIEETLFAQSGNVIFVNFYLARLLADKLNKKQNLASYPEKAIKASQLNAMGLIDEILHYIVGLYKEQRNPTVFEQALKYLENKIGSKTLNHTLNKFVESFPPLKVYKNKTAPAEYLADSTAGIPNSEITIEELLIFYLANSNPAFKPFRSLFDDTHLSKETAYRDILKNLDEFFQNQPPFGPDHQFIMDMLQTPARRYPHSLYEQLEFMRRHWGSLLSKYILRLLSSLDLIKEEERSFFTGPGPSIVLDFTDLEMDEPERFSSDLDWMPNVVMIAKSTYVWLDQLSKKYQRSINKLDQIPDEELDILAKRGFNALWLIGLWERSPISQKIKQWCGNPEAVSSAYSLYDYTIAFDLGGDPALDNLRYRAWQRGIRLASDMVPNHTGIYSKWIIEHPDWFIQSSYPVFPSYTFNGANLSEDDRIGLYIEDGYWNRSDAAVLFKRVDHSSGEVRYIYHGNDGTSMPWNDTAQLNYLNPEVREAVIQTILSVARKFSIIRLDAAMTLTKRHFQRLWFPQPGSGGDIPSRAEFAISRESFNRQFPQEFWREVVDRVAQEAPDTLLLAEAFWMMEGYFVRSMGMHRVYNSAFMNMLKNEENQKYRQAIKNVIEFNPEIMKRYVNFMNNPDEETAVAQFGKDDKYFGVCTLMVTLPGLPMFGHGQIEGFSEKYGMEYRRAYWDEQEDPYLIHRHEKEIFPLLKKRYLFSQVRNFVLYDFYNPDGSVNEDIFAFSNRSGQERAVVLYNNKYDRARGWIKHSSATAIKIANSMVQMSLLEGLGLTNQYDFYSIFRDTTTGMEFIRNNNDIAENGLYAELDGFKYHVFLDFREVQDNEYQHYAQLNAYLNGRGVPSINEALKETFLTPVHAPFRELINFNYLKELDLLTSDGRLTVELERALSEHVKSKLFQFLKEIKNFSRSSNNEDKIYDDLLKKFTFLLHVYDPKSLFELPETKTYHKMINFMERNGPTLSSLYIWLMVHKLGMLQDEYNVETISISWLDEFLLAKLINQILHLLGYDDHHASRTVLLLKAMIIQSNWMEQASESIPSALEALFQNQETNQYLQINRYHDVLYINKESLQELVAAFLMIAFINLGPLENLKDREVSNKLHLWFKITDSILKSAQDAGYRVEVLQQLVS